MGSIRHTVLGTTKPYACLEVGRQDEEQKIKEEMLLIWNFTGGSCDCDKGDLEYAASLQAANISGWIG